MEFKVGDFVRVNHMPGVPLTDLDRKYIGATGTIKEILQWNLLVIDISEYSGVPLKYITMWPETLELYNPAPNSGGLKYDSGKLRWGLLTRGLAKPLSTIAAVLTYGAEKYEADSWQTVPEARMRYEDALDRHLNSWKSGESHDEESGLHHLSHVITNAMFLLWFTMQDTPHAKYIDFNKVEKPVNP